METLSQQKLGQTRQSLDGDRAAPPKTQAMHSARTETKNNLQVKKS